MKHPAKNRDNGDISMSRFERAAAGSAEAKASALSPKALS
jgi:hypothetical protein